MSIRRTAKAEPGARSLRAGGFASWAAGLGLLVGLVNTILLLALIAGRQPEGGDPDTGERMRPPAGIAEPSPRGAVAEEATTPPVAAEEVSDTVEPVAGPESGPAPDERIEIPAAPQPAPPEARVGLRLQILNGAGVPRLAARTAEALLRQRYDIRETGNAREAAARSRILVRQGGLPLGLRLADDLGLAAERVLLEPDPRLVDVDLSLVIGADWNTLRPFR
jgi:hypothetical protein